MSVAKAKRSPLCEHRLPKRLLVTDPSGNVATFTYHADQQASRWAISQIKINGDMVTLDYQYNADGHLASIDKTMGPTGSKETVSTYSYELDLVEILTSWVRFIR